MARRKSTLEKKNYYSSADLSNLIEDTLSQFDFEHVHWLEEDEYKKAIGQFRMNIAGIFDFMKVDDKLPVRYMHGMTDFIPGAIEEIVRLTEDFGLRVRGIDKAISLEIIRRKKLMGVGEEKKNNVES
jgi:hypothetical protein